MFTLRNYNTDNCRKSHSVVVLYLWHFLSRRGLHYITYNHQSIGVQTTNTNLEGNEIRQSVAKCDDIKAISSTGVTWKYKFLCWTENTWPKNSNLLNDSSPSPKYSTHKCHAKCLFQTIRRHIQTRHPPDGQQTSSEWVLHVETWCILSGSVLSPSLYSMTSDIKGK